MQEIDAIQNKSESKIISSINNDTTENGHIVFDYREKSGYRNFDTQDWFGHRALIQQSSSFSHKTCIEFNHT